MDANSTAGTVVAVPAKSERRPLRPAASASIEDRLVRIETSLETLTSTVQQLATLIQQTSVPKEHRTPPRPIATPDTSSVSTEQGPLTDDSSKKESYDDSTRSSSLLEQVYRDLQAMGHQGFSLPENGEGSNTLRELSESLAAVKFDHDVTRDEARRVSRASKHYSIPSPQEGEMMIEKFKQLILIGRPLLSVPPYQLIWDVVYEPAKVPDTGWVLLFNCMLCTSIPADDDELQPLKGRLRWNTWVALDSASLFLEPSDIAIQAFLVLATHDDEVATPNLSWILIGHACRLAQAIALHLPASQDYECRQQRLFLFWSLFVVDKSVSLAFGRPPFLSMHYYNQVPLPDREYLSRFSPHLARQQQSIEPLGSPPSNFQFGKLVFLQGVALAKVASRVTEFLYNIGRPILNAEQRGKENDRLILDLDNWYKQTHKLLLKTVSEESTPETADELTLRMNSMRFQHLHLLIMLTRHDDRKREICMHSARQTVFMLDRFISTSDSVYNGIIWQLLYYPFTAFFALFGNVVRDPFSPTCLQDLQLLRLTVAYFTQTTAHSNCAARLEKMADSFTTIAETYVRSALRRPPVPAFNNKRLTLDSRASEPISSLDCKSDRQDSVLEQFMDEPDPTLEPFADIDADLLLGWFSDTDPSLAPGANTQQGPQSPGDAYSLLSEADLMTSLENRGLKRPLECTFDWFSWDLYKPDENCNRW